jgi:hypothetical protein
MANKKKTKKTTSKPKNSSARKSAHGKASLKRAATKKKTAVKKPARKKVVVRKKAEVKKKPPARKTKPRKVTAPNPQGLDAPEIERGLVRARAGVLSGDLQGLSRKAASDSESVDELVREGNVYEAGILQGVEEADNADEGEVTSHETLADDVPEEYLDED